MKVTEVLAKVYEPGRLQSAWHQVKQNAGAAGIDQMTVDEFALREEERRYKYLLQVLVGPVHIVYAV